jgi:hypothetical protein
MMTAVDVSLVGLVVVLAGACAVYFAARRATTIAVLAIDRGVVRIERGGVAPTVLADLRDVAKAPAIDGVRVRIVRSSGRAEVQIDGAISDAQAQRLRNVIGSVPLARLMNARSRKP